MCIRDSRRLCEQLVGVMTGRLGRPYIAQLTRDMKEASAELEFEKAALLRDQIQIDVYKRQHQTPQP